MGYELGILATTAASLGIIHTITGPDHYIPFVAISKARNWSPSKTVLVVTLCGLGHVGSSILLGIVGVLAGIGLNKLDWVETFRGSIAAWLIISFGLIYFIWGLRKAFHKHQHGHGHNHISLGDELVEQKEKKKNITPWILFIIFVFGPCEPLIPILIYPAAEQNMFNVLIISSIFGFVTIATMLTMVFAISKGVSFLKFDKIERFSHALAGFTILLCGLGIEFLNL